MPRIQTVYQFRHPMVTGPDGVRSRFKDRPKAGLVTEVAPLGSRKGSDPIVFTTLMVMCALGGRKQTLDDEIKALDGILAKLNADTVPSLVGLYGVGTDTAAILLVIVAHVAAQYRKTFAMS
jgi:hypothetical protein